MKKLVKTPYARNMWRVMDKFQVLPTDERFQSLTDPQLGFIFESMALDAKETSLARRGINPNNYFEDDDTSWWNTPTKEFTALKEDDDEEEIVRKMKERTNQAHLDKMRENFSSTEEWNKYLAESGITNRKIETAEIVRESLEKAYRDAQNIEKFGKPKHTKQAKAEELKLSSAVELSDDEMQKVIDMFNGNLSDEDLIQPDSDDDVYF